jgi:hypothetical protein
MPKFILRFLSLGVLCAGAAFGQQGSFGQIAYGGSWQTTFTLVNLSSASTATGTLSFFGDNGSPLIAPVQGYGNVSVYTFAIPPGGSQSVVLSTSDLNTIQGWASMSTTGAVRGQASFRVFLPKGGISEAVVPLTLPGSALCILPFPPSGDPVILIPFDNTNGQYVTSIAIANTTTVDMPSIAMEFVDQSNNLLQSATTSLLAMQHTAFVTTDRYQALAGQKGIVRIHADPAKLTVLALLSNLASTGSITTILPVTQ